MKQTPEEMEQELTELRKRVVSLAAEVEYLWNVLGGKAERETPAYKIGGIP